jgi:hypothetical protein
MAKPGKWALEHLALVSSFGIYWDREKTDWPHMLGERGSGRNRRVADFTEQMGLYILYAGNEPRYVGVADRLGVRIGDHERDRLKKEWDHVAWFGSTVVPEVKSDGVVSVPFPSPRHRPIVVVPKRTWHDFEAVLFHAFRFSIGPSRFGTEGLSLKVPYFGGNAQKWAQHQAEARSGRRRA